MAAVAAGALDLAVELLLEAAPVEEVGERIAARQVGEPRLEALALGDVEAHADGAGDGAVAVAQRLDVELVDAIVEGVLEGDRLPLERAPVRGDADTLARLRPEHLLDRAAERERHPPLGRASEREGVAQRPVGGPEEGRHLPHDHPQPALALGQSALHLRPLADVEAGAEDALHHAALVGHRRGRDEQADLLGATDRLDLDLEGGLGAVEQLRLLASHQVEVLPGEEPLPGTQARDPVDPEHAEQRWIGVEHLPFAAVLPDAHRVLRHQRVVALVAVGARALGPADAAEQHEGEHHAGREQHRRRGDLGGGDLLVQPVRRVGERDREVVGDPLQQPIVTIDPRHHRVGRQRLVALAPIAQVLRGLGQPADLVIERRPRDHRRLVVGHVAHPARRSTHQRGVAGRHPDSRGTLSRPPRRRGDSRSSSWRTRLYSAIFATASLNCSRSSDRPPCGVLTQAVDRDLAGRRPVVHGNAVPADRAEHRQPAQREREQHELHRREDHDDERHAARDCEREELHRANSP